MFIQQTMWLYTSQLQGRSYSRNDFLERIVDQFETNASLDYDPHVPENRQQIESGVDAFWNAFQAVGTEAKVIRVLDQESPSSDNSAWDQFPYPLE